MLSLSHWKCLLYIHFIKKFPLVSLDYAIMTVHWFIYTPTLVDHYLYLHYLPVSYCDDLVPYFTEKESNQKGTCMFAGPQWPTCPHLVRHCSFLPLLWIKCPCPSLGWSLHLGNRSSPLDFLRILLNQFSIPWLKMILFSPLYSIHAIIFQC